MKLPPILLAAMLAAPPGAAAAPAAAPFVPIPSDYKKAQQVPDSFFDPFRARDAADSGGMKKDPAATSDEAVATALLQRGVSGIALGGPAAANRVIIGDQVFGVGDTLEFPAKDNDDPAPLVQGAGVILRSVQRDSLVLEIDPDGEASRRFTFPLNQFWRP